jgi:mono/diheme cytochrome c family protein
LLGGREPVSALVRTMMARRIAVVVAGACAVAIAAFFALAWRASIEPIAPPDARSFDPALVRRGAELAAIGNCNVCHSAPGGRSFAGSVALATPFGTIYSTNITPEPETGIGRWSEAAFQRSMRAGVDRAGRHLYPGFPYDHFTLVTDDDNKALYAYLMSREPVRSLAPANDLHFPFNMRIMLAGWKLLFLREGPYEPVGARSETWNRGAYLVEGLAHCGACHTPRNAWGAEKKDDRFAGGEAEGWAAYALNAQSPAPVPWNADALSDYLRNGWQEAHGVARGPMAPVVGNLASAGDAHVRAIATYMASVLGEPTPERRRQADALLARTRANGPGSKPISGDSETIAAQAGEQVGAAAGALIYASACATCHESGRPLPFGGVDLALSTAMQGPNAHNVINVVLAGLPAAEGERSPIMPGFSGALTDEQLVELIGYLRARFSDKPPWSDIAKDLHGARTAARSSTPHTSAVVPADAVQ